MSSHPCHLATAVQRWSKPDLVNASYEHLLLHITQGQILRKTFYMRFHQSYNLLASWGRARMLVVPGNPPSNAAFRTSSRFPAVTKLRSARTLAGSSSRSFSLRFGRMTCFTPALWAARTLSLIPPTCGRQTNQVAPNCVLCLNLI